jgi:hypothetical protein
MWCLACLDVFVKIALAVMVDMESAVVATVLFLVHEDWSSLPSVCAREDVGVNVFGTSESRALEYSDTSCL